MIFTIHEYTELIIFMFSIYVFSETKLYFFLWYSLFELLNCLMSYFNLHVVIFKMVIVTYVIMVVLGYLYKFRYLLFKKITIKEPMLDYKKLAILETDKNKRFRIGVSVIFFIITYIVGIYFLP